MDGCVVDFIDGIMRAHNVMIPPRDIRWNIFEQMGLDESTFWSVAGKEFWESLGWTAEGKDLVRGVEKLFGENVVILSSPCETPGCTEGKRNWIRRELPNYRKRCFFGSAKELLAGPGKILADDYEANIEKFGRAGGTALLVPRPWNWRRLSTDERGCFDVDDVLADLDWLRKGVLAA
jgi:hypothetical protein